MDRRRATLVGFLAILSWAALALLATWTGAIPPFERLALAFGIAGLVGLPAWVKARPPLSPLIWAVGIGGLFGFHALYFAALALSPPVEASLVTYLWPLLIVVFSGFLPGERLRWWHVVGGCLGLAGAVLLVTGGDPSLHVDHPLGLLAALAAALTWATYSLISRRMGDVPTASIGGFCIASAALALLCHLVFEASVWPGGIGAWAAILALGLGPMGLAFYAWDWGMKRGNVRALGGASYLAPLISTLLLVLAGPAPPTSTLGLACILISAGAILAAREAPPAA